MVHGHLFTWIELFCTLALCILSVPALSDSLSAIGVGIIEPQQYKKIAVQAAGMSRLEVKKKEMMRRVSSVLLPFEGQPSPHTQRSSLIQEKELRSRHPTNTQVEELKEASRKALDALNGLNDMHDEDSESDGSTRSGREAKESFEFRAQIPKNGFTNRSWFKKYEALESTRQKAVNGLKLINEGGHYDEDNRTFVDGKKIGPPETMADHLNTANLKDCHNIFVDLGANLGVHVREIFEPELFPVSPMLPVLEKYFGAPEARHKSTHASGACAFGFEANPYFTPYLQKIQDRYALKGWQVQFFSPAVVSDSDGTVEFYVDHRPGNSFWGSSVFPCCNHQFTEQRLPAFNVAAFVQNLVNKRPANTTGKIVVKMDLEGSEFVILPAMLTSGVLCKGSGVDALYVEWHPWAVANQTGSYLTPDEIKMQIDQQIACDPTTIIDMDDETYKDGGLMMNDGTLNDWNSE